VPLLVALLASWPQGGHTAVLASRRAFRPAKEAQPVDLVAQVARRQMCVRRHRQLGIGVPQDPRHRGKVRAAHHQQRRRRVTQVVEPDVAHLRFRPEQVPMRRTAPRIGVGRREAVAAALLAADVLEVRRDAGLAQRAAQDARQVVVVAKPTAVLGRKHIRTLGRPDGRLQEGEELVGDGHDILATSFCRVSAVRMPHKNKPLRQPHVFGAQAEQLALAQAGVDRGGEQRPPCRRQCRQHARHLVGL
jgi:hypothetical protein